MYEQEKQRTTHLLILLGNTIFMIALTGGAILLGWKTGTVILLFFGLGVSWLLHITDTISAAVRLRLYIIITMLTFFFYGIHESAIYELSPIMVVIILLYTVAEESYLVRICAVTYYLTICYDFVFIIDRPLNLTVYTVTRIVRHLLLVFMAERLAEAMIQKRRKEREKADEKISRLGEANRRVEDFLANVSNELGTPIGAVAETTAVMLDNEDDPGKKKELLSIQMAGKRLFNQIEDILDYTEIDTGRIVVSEENYEISALFNDIIAESRLMRGVKKVELIFDMDADVPSALLGDGRKIKKIISHLIDNAVKFTQEGIVYVKVYTLHKSYGINLCIKVSDTGIGIAEEELEKIMERFFQSSGGRNRKAGGLGLGLSIVYGMVTAMDGFMQIESKEGSGTSVSVSIPQKITDTVPATGVPDSAESDEENMLRPGVKLHIAYDESTEPTAAEVPGGEDAKEQIKINDMRYSEYGISVEKGLTILKNDIEMYLNVINIFLKDRKKQPAMQQFMEEQNMKDYAILVHGLKGNARTLGADRLADIAYEHEMKSKAGDIEYVKAHWDELIAVWDNTLNGFQELYSEYRAEDYDTYGMVHDSGGGDSQLPQSDLDEVVALLDDFETEKAIEKLKTWINTPLEQSMHERIKDVLAALEDEFDEDKAIALLKDGGN